MKRFLDKEEGLERGKKKLYTLVWGQCSEIMKNELEARKDYAIMTSDQDPILLLKILKSITYNFCNQKYLPASMWQTTKALYNTMQGEDEDLKSFYDRFRNQVTVIENYGGSIGKDKCLYENGEIFKNLSEAEQKKRENIEEAQERAREKFLDYGLIANCDKKRYGNVGEDLDNTQRHSRRPMNIY